MESLKLIKISTDQGETSLPSKEELKYYVDRNYHPTLYLDANICFFLFQYYNGTVLRKEIKEDILFLIKYFQEGLISILPDYGILELVCDKQSFSFDKKKYDEIIDKVLYCFQLPLKIHTEEFSTNLFKVTYPQDYKCYHKLQSMGSQFFVIYTALLKIYVIAKRTKPSKSSFLKNLKEFLKWCDETLDTSMMFEIFLAFKIFAGESNFNKMIALGSTKKSSDEIIKIIKGTVWDLIHVRLMIDGLRNELRKSYVVSNDNNLNTLIKTISLQKIETLGNGSIVSTLIGTFDTKFSKINFEKEIEDLLDTFFEKRQKAIKQSSKRPQISSLFPETRSLEMQLLNLLTN